MPFYTEQKYHHIYDQRTPQERCQQHELIQSMVQRNLRALQIPLTEKRKVAYEPRKKIKIDLSEGWYCYITDSEVTARHTVLTLHGAPGDHVEWAGLQTQTGPCVRWINLTIPGFDKQDERRGSYNGSASHLSQLIIRLLHKLRIGKIILVGHSLGSIFASYFLPRYSDYIEGYVNVTGMVDQWYTGLMSFYHTTVANWGYNNQEWRQSKVFDKDDYREKMHKNFLELATQRSFGPVMFPKLCLTQVLAYTKLINSFPNGVSELYHDNRYLQIPRVLIFGKNDPLYYPSAVQQSIYNLCFGDSYFNQPKFQTTVRELRSDIQARLFQDFNIKVNGKRIQEYFCYLFDDTGHNAHKRRPIEIAKIMKVYMTFLEVLEDYKKVPQARL